MLIQPEAVTQNLQAFFIPVTGSLLKSFGWGVNKAVCQFTGQVFKDRLRIATLLQGGNRFGTQFIAYGFGLGAVIADRIAGALGPQPGHKFTGFLLNDSLSLNGGRLTLGHIVLNDRLQIIHAI